MEYIILIIGFIVLIKCADIFVSGSSKIAKTLKVSTLVIGLTIVAFGTSAPEASISIISSLENNSDISLGNVIGSNICNLLLVLGVSSLFNNIKVNEEVIKRDLPLSLCSYILLFLFIIFDYKIDRKEGIVFLGILFFYLYSVIKNANTTNLYEKRKLKVIDVFELIFGLIGIIIGGNVVVDQAVLIASNFNVSNSLIALTIVAIGTSLPELITSVVASIKGENEIAIGNILGSNIFNIFFILGVSSLLNPISISVYSLIDIIIMFASGLLLLLLIKNRNISNKKGILLIIIYFLYIIYIINR